MIIKINPRSFDAILDTFTDPLHRMYFAILFQFAHDAELSVSYDELCDCTSLPLVQARTALWELQKNETIFVEPTVEESEQWATTGSN